MYDIMIKEIGSSGLQGAAPFLFASAREELSKNGRVFLAYEDGKPCGALGAVSAGSLLRVVSLFVEEGSRKKGAGSALIRQAEAAAEDAGFQSIGFAYSVPAEQADGLAEFFQRNGYPYPEAGEPLYTVALQELKDTVLAELLQKVTVTKNVCRLRSLSQKASDDLQRRIGTEIPAFLQPERSAGKALPDLCLAYVKKGRVTSFLTMSDTAGELHLDGIYLMDIFCTRHLLTLLKQALETVREKYPQYQTLTMTGATERGSDLIEGLLEGAEAEKKERYLTAKSLDKAAMPVLHQDFGAAMARFQSLAERLAERDLTPALWVTEGALPYLELPFGGSEEGLGLYYDIEGKERYENFTLIGEVVFSGAEEAVSRALKEIDAEEAPYYGILSEKGELLLRGVWEEGNEEKGFDGDTLAEAFVLPFLAYAEQLMQKNGLTIET